MNERLTSLRNWSMGAFITILNRRNEVLCVRQAYANRNWTTPGGQIKDGEDPFQAVLRETREEVRIDISNLIFSGLYWKSYVKDLVFSFVASSDLNQFEFTSNSEISQAAYFDINALPSPMAMNTQVRIRDAAMRTTPQLTIFHTPDRYSRALGTDAPATF